MSTNSLQPRVYRSSEGCCICRAKSSSSRFTDSSKYENDSMKCFDLKNPRVGEICNACVLLVKRYKRLPVGSNRNWGHVVDARAGTKSLSKSKRHREDSENSGSNQGGSSTQKQQQASNNNKSLIPEKFAKIFKKTKKHKLNITTKQKKECGKRKASPPVATGITTTTPNTWAAPVSNESLPTTPESLDSEMMDDNQKMNAPNGRSVEFQTQTRASAHKTRRSFAAASAMAANRITQKLAHSMAMGSRRRKIVLPKRNFRANDHVQFFDETAWQLKKSCCGLALQCTAAPNVFIMDVSQWKPCSQHVKKTQQKFAKLPVQPVKSQSLLPTQAQISMQPPPQAYVSTQPHGSSQPPQQLPTGPPPLPQSPTCSHPPQQAHTSSQTAPQAQVMPQKSIVTTVPAVVQLAPPAAPVAHTNTTPALKKHHLFFKRQSECFPQGDMGSGANYVNNNTNNNNNNSKCTISAQPPIKVAPNANIVTPQLQQHHLHHQQQQSQLPFLQDYVHYNKQQQQTYKITSMQLDPSTSQTIVGLENITTSPPKPRNATPRHSMAKVTTITPNPNTTITTATANGKQHGFLHKIKDTGKIVKNSIERINAAVRIKPSEMHEFKQMMKTADKTCIVPPKPVVNTTVTYTGHPQHPPLPLSATTVPLPQTSSSSTKFSDNSSDSGFDENLHDRKSASPFQDENDKKMLSRPGPGVQTMFLASGVQIQGQQQNLVLTGNEVAAKFLQNRKQTTITSMHQPQQNRMNPTTTTSVKIAQIFNESNGGVHTSSGTGMSAPVTHQKMRAIYNNNNTIQHENGITTIVPASSPAATSQTAAMNNIAPSSVTITPAPHMATVPVSTTLTNLANGKKLPSGTNLINLNHNMHAINQVSTSNHISINSGAITINSNNPQNNMMNGILGQHLSAMNNNNVVSSNMNQKIILVKTTPKYANSNHNPVGPYMANQVGPSNGTTNSAAVTLSKSTLNHFKQSVCKN